LTTVFDWRRYLAVIQRKPGALRNGAPLALRTLQQRMLKTPGGDREMVEILALVLQHDEQAVLTVVEPALEAGVPTKTHMLNLLHRLVDGKPIDSPAVNDRVWRQCCDCLQTDFCPHFCTTLSCQLARER
jgi:hypothetical protein